MVFPIAGCLCSLCNNLDLNVEEFIPQPGVFIRLFLDDPIDVRLRHEVLAYLQHDNTLLQWDQNYRPYVTYVAESAERESMWVDQ